MQPLAKLYQFIVIALGVAAFGLLTLVVAGEAEMPLWGWIAVGGSAIVNLGAFFKGLYDRRDRQIAGIPNV